MSTANLNASSIRRLHQLPGLTDDENYVRTRDALATIQAARRTPITDDPDTLDNIADDLADAARNGQPIDLDEATRRVLDIERRAAARAKAYDLLAEAERHLVADVDAAARRAIPGIVARLDADLRDTLDKLAGIDRPEQLRNAETAIDHGRANDYTARQRLVAEHDSIRRAQAAIYDNSGARTHHAAALLIRNQETLMHPGDWTAAQRGGTWRNEHGELCGPTPVPWPTADADSLTSALTSPTWLNWILGNPDALALAWVPTVGQLTAETQRLDSLIAVADPPEQFNTHDRQANV